MSGTKNNLDFKKYKSSLKDLLSRLGHNTSRNPMKCFNPSHVHKSNTPSMLIYDSHFQCRGYCEAKGDVYDAVGLIKGITDKVEQFKEVQSIMGDGYTAPPAKKEFEVSTYHEKQLREYLLSQRDSNIDNIKSYLHQRNQPEDMVNTLCNWFGWWPGYEIANQDLGWEVLNKAGIPGKNPSTGKYSWGSPGVVVKLGQGFKLFFYDDKESKKIGSKKCRTFPTPALPDNDTIFLVEGENSAISMRYAGWDNTSAIGGINALTDESIKELFQYDNIYILFDGDGPGRKKRQNLKDRILSAGYTGNIYIVRIPGNDKNDPDDLIKAGKKDVIEKAIEEASKKQEEINQFIESSTTSQGEDQYYTPFQFMGYDSKNYYVIPKNQSIPIQIGRTDNQIKGMMFDLADIEWWCGKFPRETKDGTITLDFFESMNWFRVQGQRKGLYDESSLLGAGAHFDGDDIIVNTGNSLYSRNKKEKVSFYQYTGKNFYKRSVNNFDISGEAWDVPKSHELFNEILNYGFDNMLDYMLITGFIALAPFASLLDRRPHLAIIGPRGCGKTTLVDLVIKPAIGDLGIFNEGKTSEAGIRQMIGKDCRPTIIDEFEAHSPEDQQRTKNILSLARSAYGGEGQIIKGTTGQKPIVFKIKTMFMFLAININFDNDADRTRIPVLKMKKSMEKIGKSFEFSGLRKRIFNNIDNVLKNIELAKNYIVDNYGFDSRAGDTYGTLLGGFWSVVSNNEFIQSEKQNLNESVISAIEQIKINNDDIVSDEEFLLNMILNYKVKMDSYSEKTISELITETKNEQSTDLMHDNKLRQMGIRRDNKIMLDGKQKNVLAISANNNYITEILKDTPYRKYKNILLRHEAAIYEETRPIRMMANKRERCIILDWVKVKNIYFDEDEVEPF
jgi:5S rRNA maturation endonuclease (ribonuclease M5)